MRIFDGLLAATLFLFPVALIAGCTHLAEYRHGRRTVAMTEEQSQLYERQKADAKASLRDRATDAELCGAFEAAVDDTPRAEELDGARTWGATHLEVETARSLLMADEARVCSHYERLLERDEAVIEREIKGLWERMRRAGGSTRGQYRVLGIATIDRQSAARKTSARGNRDRQERHVNWLVDQRDRLALAVQQQEVRYNAAVSQAQAELESCEARERTRLETQRREAEACEVARRSIEERIDGSFESLLGSAQVPSRNSFLQQWYANCGAHHSNEFAERRCRDRRKHFRRTAPTEVWASAFVAAPVPYDFRRQRFMVPLHGSLGDAGRVVDFDNTLEAAGVFYLEDRWEEDDELREEGNVVAVAVTHGRPVSLPKESWGFLNRYPRLRAKSRTVSVELPEQIAEPIRLAGGMLALAVWRPKGSWTKSVRGRTVRGVDADLLGLQLRSPIDGRVLWSEPPSIAITRSEALALVSGNCVGPDRSVGREDANSTRAGHVAEALDNIGAVLGPIGDEWFDGKRHGVLMLLAGVTDVSGAKNDEGLHASVSAGLFGEFVRTSPLGPRNCDDVRERLERVREGEF